ncbi:MAG: hypothetical protein KIT58_12050 [Planctomycetota bacterium]|nr:hypothetical protein [Planctomycetota bacterium]
MPLTPAGLRRRIEAGKAASIIYKNDTVEGLISVWRHEDAVIVTWEECPHGQMFNECNYTRDERRAFSTVDEACEFLRRQGVDVTRFEP